MAFSNVLIKSHSLECTLLGMPRISAPALEVKIVPALCCLLLVSGVQSVTGKSSLCEVPPPLRRDREVA